MADIDEVRRDISAFADDEDDVAIERDGSIVYQRNGVTETCQIVADDDRLLVEINGHTMRYQKFLTHHLAGLPQLATKLLQKRPPLETFVEPRAELQTTDRSPETLPALEALARQCSDTSPFSSRVLFITADAGAGKTALLRAYQRQSAETFIKGISRSLFWHVDLQGRQLLRLSEALMGDLGELRFSGLYVPGIVRLLQRRVLVLGIDGFDELAAEQGSTDALGALALMVGEMQDQGVLAAASRRSFFDTDDYLRRSKLVRTSNAQATEFHELRLLTWEQAETVRYLSQASDPDSGRTFADATATYASIVTELNNDPQHPMVSRPFLVTQLARALLRYDIEPSDFIRGMGDPLKGVGELVQQFVQREVSDKWKSKETGEPYLTVEQHMTLLTTVAEEMHRSEADRVDVDVLDTLVAILVDEWQLPQDRRAQVAEMSRMHVLLPPPATGDFDTRTFDHPEFREYFVARALESLLQRGNISTLRNFLNVATISDSLAKYVRTLLDASSNSMQVVLDRLQQLVSEEWKPTHIQQNVGTLLAPLLDRGDSASNLHFKGQVVISSIALEASRLIDVTLEGVTFLNCSLSGAEWESVHLIGCKMDELTLDSSSVFREVSFLNCSIGGLRLTIEGEESSREYDPARIVATLSRYGIATTEEGQLILPEEPPVESDARKALQKLLATFRRTTTLTPETLGFKFRGAEKSLVVDSVIPLMVECGIVENRTWRGQGQPRPVWSLRFRADQILEAEGSSDETGPLPEFWRRLGALQ